MNRTWWLYYYYIITTYFIGEQSFVWQLLLVSDSEAIMSHKDITSSDRVPLSNNGKARSSDICNTESYKVTQYLYTHTVINK